MSAAATAVVAAAYGRHLLLELEGGRLIGARPRNRRIRAVCGDLVDVAFSGDEAVVTGIRPRESVLWRQDERRARRPLAANVDTLAIVAAPAPPVAPEQIDRYLAIAELLSLRPLLVANKSDLGDVPLTEFTDLGYPVFRVSARTEAGLNDLARALAGHRAVLSGLSGVGKSALITALVPEYEARSAALSTGGGGRHTTTAARLYPLRGGGSLIDSPGVRDIRLWPMPAAELAQGFREFRPYIGNCRFRNCRHEREPDCALREAVERREVGERRYRGYLDLAARLDTGGEQG